MIPVHDVHFGTFPIRECNILHARAVQYFLHTYFINSVGSGGWSLGGVTTDSVTTEGNNTFVQCTSTHLTSFAVLVDVAGSPVRISTQH